MDAFEAHADELFRHSSMRLSDRERAVELTQETFFRVWKAVSAGEEIRHYRAFFYRILNNLIIDEYRKRKSQSLDTMLENEETGAAVEGTLLRADTDIIEEAISRFDSAEAIKALKKLPEPYKTAIILRYIDGLSIPEIAESTGHTENAVSVRLNRALHKLRKLITLDK